MPVDLTQYVGTGPGQYSQQVIDAVQQILASKPEQIAQNTGADGQFDLPSFINGTAGWWAANGAQQAGNLSQFGPEMNLLNALGVAQPTAAAPGSTPGAATTPANPTTGNDLSQFVGTGPGKYPQPVIDAVRALFAAKPDQQQSFTQNYGGDLSRFLDASLGWWAANGAQQTANIDQFDPEMQVFGAMADAGDQNATRILAGAGYQNVPDTTTMPLEQGLLQNALPGLMGDINADTGRRGIVDALTGTVLQGADNANAILGRTQGGGQFDGAVYMRSNPDVQQYFNSQPNGTAPGTKSIVVNGNPQDMTDQQFAQYHFDTYGRNEGRQPTFTQSQQLQSDFANANQNQAANIAAANQSAATQLAALSQATAQLQQNLTGEQRARADALQQQLASLTQNLGQYSAAQQAAIVQQMATQQQALQQSVASQQAAVGTSADAQRAAANTQANDQLNSLAQSTAALTQNLSGESLAKAQALQAQIASLTQNLGTLDAAQRAALTQQIVSQQQNLEQSIATQRQGLTDQLAALNAAASGNAAAKVQSLQQEIAALGNANDAQAQARRAALQTQISTLQSASTQEAQAKRASLEQELAGLTAAQAPVAAARTAAADLQATAINVGLERTQDQLTAQNAQAGFVGGSTGQDAARLRATIGARQSAAEAMGSANLANAQDTRDIGVRGATGQRTIADTLAEAQRQITGQGATDTRGISEDTAANQAAIAARGATGQRTIADVLADTQQGIAGQGATGNAALTAAQAQGTQTLGDTKASGLAGIAANTAQTQAAIEAQGANTTFANALANAASLRNIGDTAAQTAQKIRDALAAQGFTIGVNEATQIQTLANQLATGTQANTNQGAALTGALAGNVATQAQTIGNAGATQAYTDTTTGAAQGRTIADALAQGNYGITSNNAANVLAANQQANAARATYYDNDYSRSLAAALAPASIAGNTATSLTALDNYGRSGLNNTLNTLNWWNTNTTAAPTAGAIATTADTTGNSISNLGAGLLGAAGNVLTGVGQANNWWRTPTTTTPSAVMTTPNASGDTMTPYITTGRQCWIAREVYGAANPKWMQFRGWMLAEAPAWFRKFYLENGERIAEEIRNLPSIKARVRGMMDEILAGGTA